MQYVFRTAAVLFSTFATVTVNATITQTHGVETVLMTTGFLKFGDNSCNVSAVIYVGLDPCVVRTVGVLASRPALAVARSFTKEIFAELLSLNSAAIRCNDTEVVTQ